MSIRVALDHTTVYRYAEPVTLSPHVVRLRPAPHCRTPIESYSLTVEPAEHFINWQQDPFGNYLARLVFPEKARELRVTVDLIAELTVINPFDFFVEPEAEELPVRRMRTAEPPLRSRPSSTSDPATERSLRRSWIDANLRPKDGTTGPWIALVGVNRELAAERIGYRGPDGAGRADAASRRSTIGKGSCRDTGWLLVELLRHVRDRRRAS